MAPKSAREEILGTIRAALGGAGEAPADNRPMPMVRVADRLSPRTAGKPDDELEQALSEISSLGGLTRRLAHASEFGPALSELIRAEQVHSATLWQTPELQALGIADLLRGQSVEIVSPYADSHILAACDLGVTGVDAVLPEIGTLLLRSGPDRPRLVSLLPRVHLALVRPANLQADLRLALSEVKDAGYAVCITGPSRTADIELTVTIGVHGPKVLYVWVID